MADAGILAWYYKLLYYLWRPVIGIRERDLSMGPKADLADAKNVIVPKCDPFWVPLGSPRTNANSAPTKSFTPPFPSYPSGHATFGAACFEIVRNFYGFDANTPDTISLEFVSDELNGNSRDSYFGQRTRHVRRFDSLIELLYENAVSRIFLGVHWRFDGTSVHRPSDVIGDTRNVGGVPLGRAIAIDIFNAGMPKTGGTCAPIVRAIA
jgi:vanadium chloroperoxidase